MNSVREVNILDIFKDKKEENTCIGGIILLITLVLFVVFCVLTSACHAQELTASYYSHSSLHAEGTAKYNPRHIMANGEVFQDDKMVAANNDFKLGTQVRVTNKANGKNVVVKIADRTNKRYKGIRIDLSIEAMRRLDGLKQGLVPCVVEAI